MARLISTPILVKIGHKMWLLEQVEISQKEGVCVKMGYDLGPSQAPAPLGDRSHSSNESNLKSRDL